MTEEDARAWLIECLRVPRETMALLEALREQTVAANAQQNLIAKSTIDTFWARHLADSAQLIPLADSAGPWIDLGSGAGFPGLVVSLLTPRQVTLIDERRKRAEHLERLVVQLELQSRTKVVHGRVEQQPSQAYAVISARAFAPLERLFAVAHHLSSPNTIWILPKGRTATSELEAAKRTWQGSFRIEPSITDPDGAIIIATGVEPRRRR
jgi:16S rRNA (guanine527-N7)-methyltransferase